MIITCRNNLKKITERTLNRHLHLNLQKIINMDFLQGKKILHKENELISAEVALKKKTLILYYFTTGDSEPCRSFDIHLKEVYQEAITRKAELAVIVVSTDSDIESFKNNLRNNYHEFYAIPFGDELQHLLKFNYGVTCVPTLIVVRKSGTMVTAAGKSDIETIGKNVLVTWSE